jgi:hypothetical protein
MLSQESRTVRYVLLLLGECKMGPFRSIEVNCMRLLVSVLAYCATFPLPQCSYYRLVIFCHASQAPYTGQARNLRKNPEVAERPSE